MNLIDGKALADEIKLEVRQKIVRDGITPSLAVILVGHDAASELYVRMKETACKQVGIDFHTYFLPEETKEEEVLATIDFLNRDETIHAILVQLPLPEHLNEDTIIKRLDPAKDVDGFHPENIQALIANKPRLVPGLALGVLKLLEKTETPLQNKSAVIIGWNPVFTKPMAYLLAKVVSEVVTIKPDDDRVVEACRQADIIITAAGASNFITNPMIKDEAIIIDIGINKTAEGKTVGDVDVSAAQEHASYLTPVPGGVGPVTVAMLLFNTLILAEAQNR